MVSCWANDPNPYVEGCSVCMQERGWNFGGKGREGEKDLSLSASASYLISSAVHRVAVFLSLTLKQQFVVHTTY